VRPERAQGHGQAWDRLLAVEDELRGWVEGGLQLTNIHGKLTRQRGGAVSDVAPVRGRAVRLRPRQVDGAGR